MAKSAAFARIKRDILTLTASIPVGKISTYKSIAVHLDVMPRQVAYILATLKEADRDTIPWYRVVAEGGVISLPNAAKAEAQIQHLQEEGIQFEGDRQIKAFKDVFIAAAPSGTTPGGGLRANRSRSN